MPHENDIVNDFTLQRQCPSSASSQNRCLVMLVWHSLLKSGGVHDKLHIPVRTGGIFYVPLHRHQIEGTDGF